MALGLRYILTHTTPVQEHTQFTSSWIVGTCLLPGDNMCEQDLTRNTQYSYPVWFVTGPLLQPGNAASNGNKLIRTMMMASVMGDIPWRVLLS